MWSHVSAVDDELSCRVSPHSSSWVKDDVLENTITISNDRAGSPGTMKTILVAALNRSFLERPEPRSGCVDVEGLVGAASGSREVGELVTCESLGSIQSS